MKPIIVGISGASGSLLAKGTVDELISREIPTALVCSNDARLVWQEEIDQPFTDVLSEWRESPWFNYYSVGDMRAPMASGTNPYLGMVVVPCSMRAVAAMAHGLASNLLLRAADVCLKEKRRLVVVPRETPLHATHLENMLTLARMGATILPPDPAFYLNPRSINDVVRFIVDRIMLALGIQDQLDPAFQYRSKEE
jgi:4-hydroxy-3-polyprenylbenzoate decarboxylase